MTHIPGSSTTTGTISGQNNVLLDEDAQTAKNWQSVKYNANSDITEVDQLQMLPQTVAYMANGANRDWFKLAMHMRNADHADWETLDATKDTPVIWSETRLHLQKAWLATSSEFLSAEGNIQYEKTSGDFTNATVNPNYAYFGTWNESHSDYSYRNIVDSITDRSGAVALEYDEDTTVQLQAYNYGDWNLDGVTFLYTFAYGMKPVVDADGNLDVSQILAYTNSGDSKSGQFDSIDAQNIEAELIQTPETKNPIYLAPNSMRDAAQNDALRDDDTAYYAAEDYTPYVVKITVKTPLKKWYNRGSDFGYILRVQLPARVYSNATSGTWYDRVLTQPYVTENSENALYYQIYDVDHWDGSTKTLAQHNQLGGMDYLWSPAYYHWYYSDQQLETLRACVHNKKVI